jgi:hypothetical protein
MLAIPSRHARSDSLTTNIVDLEVRKVMFAIVAPASCTVWPAHSDDRIVGSRINNLSFVILPSAQGGIQ